MDKADLMTKAAKLRRQLGCSESQPVDIFLIAQNIPGLTVVLYPMGSNLSGMCVKINEELSLIAVNSEMSYGRQRFSMAHEFYHLFYDKSDKAICRRDFSHPENSTLEKEADFFATQFLMPQTELETKVDELAAKHPYGKLTIENVIEIEQCFMISHKATMLRLKGRPQISRNRFEEYYNEPGIRTIAMSMGFRPDLYLPTPEKHRYCSYGSYIRMASEIHRTSRISDGKYEELLLSAFRPDLVYGEEEELNAID